jgi:hypothetical protein
MLTRGRGLHCHLRPVQAQLPKLIAETVGGGVSPATPAAGESAESSAGGNHEAHRANDLLLTCRGLIADAQKEANHRSLLTTLSPHSFPGADASSRILTRALVILVYSLVRVEQVSASSVAELRAQLSSWAPRLDKLSGCVLPWCCQCSPAA